MTTDASDDELPTRDGDTVSPPKHVRPRVRSRPRPTSSVSTTTTTTTTSDARPAGNDVDDLLRRVRDRMTMSPRTAPPQLATPTAKTIVSDDRPTRHGEKNERPQAATTTTATTTTTTTTKGREEKVSSAKSPKKHPKGVLRGPKSARKGTNDERKNDAPSEESARASTGAEGEVVERKVSRSSLRDANTGNVIHTVADIQGAHVFAASDIEGHTAAVSGTTTADNERSSPRRRPAVHDDDEEDDDDDDSFAEFFSANPDDDDGEETAARPAPTPRPFRGLWEALAQWTTPRAVALMTKWCHDDRGRRAGHDNDEVVPTLDRLSLDDDEDDDDEPSYDDSDVGVSRCAGVGAMLRPHLDRCAESLHRAASDPPPNLAVFSRRVRDRVARLLRTFDYERPTPKLDARSWRAVALILTSATTGTVLPPEHYRRAMESIGVDLAHEEYGYLVRSAIPDLGRGG